MNVPKWRRELFGNLAEKLFSEVSELTETELRSLRNELSIYENSHAFEHEASRKAIRAFIDILGTLIFRF